MDDIYKKTYEISHLKSEINEREKIINAYRSSGYLDREKAIEKILQLRQTDEKILTVTSLELAQQSIPFSQASNESIISELQMQLEILHIELLEKTKNF